MHSLRTKITAATISGIVITMIIAAVFGIAAIKNIGAKSSEQMLLLLCEAGQKNLDASLLEVEQDVDMISAYVESDLNGLDDQKLQAHLDRVSGFFEKILEKTKGIKTYYYRIDPAVSSDVKGFWYVSTDGKGFEKHEVTDITKYDTEDTSQLVWFTVPKATGEPVWLPPYITDNLDVQVISYNKPVYLDGKFVGVIGIELDHSFMASLVDNITLYENGYAFVCDAEGNIVYHPHMNVAAMETLPDTPEGMKSEDQIVHYRYGGTDKIAVSLPLRNSDHLVVSVPQSEVNSSWQKWINATVIAFFLLLVVFILFITRFAGRITKPLQDLTKMAEEIDAGNYDCSLDYSGDDEIGTLTRTFSRVTANLRIYISDLNNLTKQLTMQKESLSALLDHMPAISFSKDAETGVYLSCNQAFADYAHLKSAKDAIGRTDAEIYSPETAAHFVECDRKTLSMEEPFVYSETVKGFDGVVRYLQTTKLKYVDQSGRLRIMGICIDITDSRAKTQADSMITAMAADYRCVYYVNLDEDDGVCYRTDSNYPDMTPVGVHFSYLERCRWYAENYVTDMYRDGFMDFISPDNIRDRLATEPIIAYRYLAKKDDQEYYEMIRAAGVRRAEERDDHMVHAIGLGLTVIDAEMRDSMAKNEALVEALSLAEEAG